MKTFNLYLPLTLISVLIATFSSCENAFQSEDFSFSEMEKTETLITNKTYLGFEGDLHDPQVIWKNMEIYLSAYDRMVEHLRIENNQLIWDCHNAADLNISQNIYEYVIFMWEYYNTKLNSGNYTIKMNGKYFGLQAKDPGIMLLTPQILIAGNHSRNMSICVGVVRNARPGWLGNYIDLINSDMRPDSWGATAIKGRGTYSSGIVWSYIAYNATPNNPYSINNDIATNAAYETGGVFYERLLNYQHAPLVVVINANAQ